MTPQEVKAVALARAIKTLADIGATYTVEADGQTFTNAKTKQVRVLDWSRYEAVKRLREAKAGDILEFKNDGDDLAKLQGSLSGSCTRELGAGNSKTEIDRVNDQVVVYVFASPVNKEHP